MTKLSQKTRDKLSKCMMGNQNAVGNKSQTGTARKKKIDHRKILDKIDRWCRKKAYKETVARSAAYLLFMDASREDQIRYMKRVKRILR